MKQSFHTDFRLTNKVVFLMDVSQLLVFYHEVFSWHSSRLSKHLSHLVGLLLDLKGWFVHP